MRTKRPDRLNFILQIHMALTGIKWNEQRNSKWTKERKQHIKLNYIFFEPSKRFCVRILFCCAHSFLALRDGLQTRTAHCCFIAQIKRVHLFILLGILVRKMCFLCSCHFVYVIGCPRPAHSSDVLHTLMCAFDFPFFWTKERRTNKHLFQHRWVFFSNPSLISMDIVGKMVGIKRDTNTYREYLCAKTFKSQSYSLIFTCPFSLRALAKLQYASGKFGCSSIARRYVSMARSISPCS